MLVILKKYWLKLAEILWWINTRIIMFFLFFFIFVPIWLIMKLLWKDLLNKKIDKNLKSYWINRNNQPWNSKFQF